MTSLQSAEKSPPPAHDADAPAALARQDFGALPPSAAIVHAHLLQCPDGLLAGDLTDRVPYTGSGVYHALNALEEAGYVERTPLFGSAGYRWHATLAGGAP